MGKTCRETPWRGVASRSRATSRRAMPLDVYRLAILIYRQSIRVGLHAKWAAPIHEPSAQTPVRACPQAIIPGMRLPLSVRISRGAKKYISRRLLVYCHGRFPPCGESTFELYYQNKFRTLNEMGPLYQAMPADTMYRHSRHFTKYIMFEGRIRRPSNIVLSVTCQGEWRYIVSSCNTRQGGPIT
jgi:hypothetical protein